MPSDKGTVSHTSQTSVGGPEGTLTSKKSAWIKTRAAWNKFFSGASDRNRRKRRDGSQARNNGNEEITVI